MPIYGYGVSSAPWTICKDMNKKKLVRFINIMKKAANKEYGLDEIFLKTITYNTKLEKVYIAKYDMSKCNMNEFTYQKQIERLIFVANKMISTGAKTKNMENFKFDIAGTWSIGEIIIMTKNKTE